MVAAYTEFEARAGLLAGGRGSKRAGIYQFVRSNISNEFTIEDVRKAVPGTSDSYINKTLGRMKREGLIRSEPAGAGSRWRRLRTDF